MKQSKRKTETKQKLILCVTINSNGLKTQASEKWETAWING